MKKVVEKIRSIVFKNAMLIAVILLSVFLIFRLPVFFTKTSLLNLCSQAACFGIVTVGMMMEMITGVSDTSVGAGVYLAGVLGCRVFLVTKSIPLSLLTAIVTGVMGSCLTGVCVAHLRIPDMITGMAVGFILRGIGNLVIGAETVVNLNDPEYQWFGQGKILGVAVPVFAMITMFIIGTLILHFTRFGRYVYAVGDNRDALRASGVDSNKIQMLCFAFTGVCVGLAGFFYVARVGGTTFGIGESLDFNCIAACAVGGVNVAGGSGNMPSALIGVAVIGAISQLLRLLNVPQHYYQMVWGLVVIISVGFGILKNYQKNYERIRRTAELRAKEVEENA